MHRLILSAQSEFFKKAFSNGKQVHSAISACQPGNSHS